MAEIQDAMGQQWKAMQYKQLAGGMAKCTEPITSADQFRDPKKTPKMWNRIDEVIRTGKLGQLEELKQQPDTRAVKNLTKLHGIGNKTARLLYRAHKVSTLEQLRAAVAKGRTLGLPEGTLSILPIAEELLERIPRNEVEAIGLHVRSRAEKLKPELSVDIMGSYRRGKPSSGDVDVLLGPPPGEEKCEEIAVPLIEQLTQEGFLTHHLASPSRDPNAICQTYMGVCKLPPDPAEPHKARLHRRIDIKVYPAASRPFALLYFTGSEHFNRSMRYFAKRENYSLSDKALRIRGNDERQREFWDKVEGLMTEADVFQHLKLEYVHPTDREAEAKSTVFPDALAKELAVESADESGLEPTSQDAWMEEQEEHAHTPPCGC